MAVILSHYTSSLSGSAFVTLVISHSQPFSSWTTWPWWGPSAWCSCWGWWRSPGRRQSPGPAASPATATAAGWTEGSCTSTQLTTTTSPQHFLIREKKPDSTLLSSLKYFHFDCKSMDKWAGHNNRGQQNNRILADWNWRKFSNVCREGKKSTFLQNFSIPSRIHFRHANKESVLNHVLQLNGFSHEGKCYKGSDAVAAHAAHPPLHPDSVLLRSTTCDHLQS